MEKEIWKDVPGYSGKYQVSNQGRVKSLLRNKELIMSFDLTETGYYQVSLSDKGVHKRYKVHKLVALAFLPNPSNLPQVNHKNEIKTDNRVDNLEWCTSVYNLNYGTRIQRMSEKHRKKVKCLDSQIIYESVKKASEILGLDKSHIVKCCKGKLKHICGYHFNYA